MTHALHSPDDMINKRSSSPARPEHSFLLRSLPIILADSTLTASLRSPQEVPVPTTPTTAMALTVVCGGEEILEGVLAFLLVYTAQVALDPRPHQQGGKRGFAATALGALALGLAAGACVLSEGLLTSATSMNPARSFGAAVVTGDFNNQAVYWAVPMIGAAVAAAAYHVVACPMSGARRPSRGTGTKSSSWRCDRCVSGYRSGL